MEQFSSATALRKRSVAPVFVVVQTRTYRDETGAVEQTRCLLLGQDGKAERFRTPDDAAIRVGMARNQAHHRDHNEVRDPEHYVLTIASLPTSLACQL